jgi:hypothetical protein
MTRINRPDTLLTELRDLKRRLRLLEAGRMRPAGAAALRVAGTPLAAAGGVSPVGAASAGVAPPVPLVPTRPVDWPATESAEWERLAAVVASGGGQVTVNAVADPETEGEVRLVVDDSPGSPVPVNEVAVADTTAVSGGAIAVEARRTGGTGLVRVIAVFQPTQPDEARPA